MAVSPTPPAARKPERRAPEAAPDTSRALVALRSRRLSPLLFPFLAMLLVAMTLLDIGMGEASVAQVVTPNIVLQVIGRHIPLLSEQIPPLPESHRYVESIVWDQRVPRALGGALIGMLLALAGVAFQSLLMNPLADPYTVGVSSGSALGSMVALLLGGAGWLGGMGQPVAAFASGMTAMLIVYALAQVSGRVSAQTFLLAGVNVGVFFWSLIPLLLALASRSGRIDRQSAILSQLLGNLQMVGWNSVGLLLPFGLAGGLLLWLSARELNLMTLGEESAAHLGVNTQAFKLRVIVAGSLVTAAAVSVAGIIAFIGLLVPHIARRLVGPDHRVLLPAAMLLGGLVIVFSDWLSRVFLAQLEIGVITSLLGAPVFCYLLRRRVAPNW
jgi:iron complex transport system permease protein